MKAVYGEASFFSYNKKLDWEKGWAANLSITEKGILLKSTERYSASRIIRLGNVGAIREIADFTVGQYGLLYLVDMDANLWMYDSQNEQAEMLFKQGHSLFTSSAVIAVSGDIIYLADPAGQSKITAFYKSNGQILWQIDQLGDIQLWPLAISADEMRNLYVTVPIDTVELVNGDIEIPVGGRIGVVKIDISGKMIGFFCHDDFRLKQRSKVLDLRKSFFSTVSRDSLYVLDALAGSVFGFSTEGLLQVKLSLSPDIRPAGIGVDSKNNIYLGDSRKIGLDAEDDRFILKYSSKDKTPEKVSGFRGRVDRLLLDRKDRIYIRNGEASSIVVLELKQKVSEMDNSGLPHGIYISTCFDSRVTETQWDKLELVADIPENTQIKVSCFSSDRQSFIIDGKLCDLNVFIKDDTVSLQEKLKSLNSLWTDTVVNPKDMLFRSAKGQYLWLKIELIGSEGDTPVLRKIRVYYPRISYLRYLPAIYQEDKQSSDFLERYLSLFETFNMEMEENINNIASYFDIGSVSGQYLRWLATWLVVDVDESWGDQQLRQLLVKAPEIYKKRGTRQAIEEIIEIYTGEKPFILEYFQFKHLKDKPGLKDLTAMLYGSDPYSFCVLVKQALVSTQEKLVMVQKILNQEKPAFTEAKLVVLQPWIYLDMHTYLGINTYLSELSLLCLNQECTIPYSSVMIDVDRDSRMDMHTRLGLDVEIK